MLCSHSRVLLILLAICPSCTCASSKPVSRVGRVGSTSDHCGAAESWPSARKTRLVRATEDMLEHSWPQPLEKDLPGASILYQLSDAHWTIGMDVMEGKLKGYDRGANKVRWIRNFREDDSIGMTRVFARHGDVLLFINGTTVRALDRIEGKDLWHYSGAQNANSFRYWSSARSNADTFFLISDDGAVVALDANSGELRWRVSLAEIAPSVTPRLALITPSTLAVSQHVVVASMDHETLVGLRAADGTRLWTLRTPGSSNSHLKHGFGKLYIQDDMVIALAQGEPTVLAVGLTSGEMRWKSTLAGQQHADFYGNPSAYVDCDVVHIVGLSADPPLRAAFDQVATLDVRTGETLVTTSVLGSGLSVAQRTGEALVPVVYRTDGNHLALARREGGPQPAGPFRVLGRVTFAGTFPEAYRRRSLLPETFAGLKVRVGGKTVVTREDGGFEASVDTPGLYDVRLLDRAFQSAEDPSPWVTMPRGSVWLDDDVREGRVELAVEWVDIH